MCPPLIIMQSYAVTALLYISSPTGYMWFIILRKTDQKQIGKKNQIHIKFILAVFNATVTAENVLWYFVFNKFEGILSFYQFSLLLPGGVKFWPIFFLFVKECLSSGYFLDFFSDCLIFQTYVKIFFVQATFFLIITFLFWVREWYFIYHGESEFNHRYIKYLQFSQKYVLNFQLG